MQEIKQRMNDLFRAHVTGSLQEAEKIEFYTLLEQYPDLATDLGQEVLQREILSDHTLSEASKQVILQSIFSSAAMAEAGFQKEEKPASLSRFISKWGWLAAASVIIIFLFVIPLFKTTKESTVKENTPQTVNIEIPAGMNGAILTLSDGTNILLDTISHGVLSLQGGSRATVAEGVLSYDTPAGQSAAESAAMNTMTTPNGRQFNLKLSDGTLVWLNAGSSIRYPTIFIADQRIVEITGEAYFEVAKNKAPFRVFAGDGVEIEVLGTHFNVNAYSSNAQLATTVLEGKVRVKKEAGRPSESASGSIASAGFVDLLPGQQALASWGEATLLKVEKNINTDQVMAWKNGLFDFGNANLSEIMKQFERWYDIEVVYEGGVPDVKLSGKLNRGVALNELLPALKKMGVNLKLEGRKLIILK